MRDRDVLQEDKVSLASDIRSRLTLPAICAPMFLVTGPALVREACKAGLVGGLPRQNARSLEEFESWLKDIRGALDAHAWTLAPYTDVSAC